MITTVDLHEAVVRVWNDSGLNEQFTQYWSEADKLTFPVLHDTKATPAQPFPFCVFEVSVNSVVTRMTSSAKKGRKEIHDTPWVFRVYARYIQGVNKSAKRIAAELNERIMMKFGGHPSIAPDKLELENGGVILARYVSDMGVRSGEEEWSWILSYLFRSDVPMAA